MSKPANLQCHGLTVREAAKIMNVSERSVYSAMKIHRLAKAQGRQDIIHAVEQGRMSINGALKQLTATNPKQDRLAAICRAWKQASEQERLDFLCMIECGEI
ncbi:lipopolysaccharide biosynthesis protein [Microvirga lupini]|uniref:Lipopolysaccharide biosynthesis protein n=1 Tax=Microvirga lupini TaxID=420324 RepID=A0A7W4VK26_9HYPH|nr:hypothetical protein [Microvirga lupini]MBB3018610.1 lipopolysaccharide biosynthesis protein [Microvirga lupini]